MEFIDYAAFEKVEVRPGIIVEVEDFPKARKPAYKLKIDFGSPLGIKRSRAQITALYKKEDLVGKTVLCVVNFKPKDIAGFSSEVLTLGVTDSKGDVVLIVPEYRVEPGVKMF